MNQDAVDAFMQIFGYTRSGDRHNVERFRFILDVLSNGPTTAREIFKALPYEYCAPECVQNALKNLERRGLVRRASREATRGRATIWEKINA